MDRKYYRGKYLNNSFRYKKWNYKNSALYFVTICTYRKVRYFGEIKGSIVRLSEIGRVVENEWLNTPNVRPDMNIKLGEYIVMPDHFHGIISIGRNQFNSGSCRDTLNVSRNNSNIPCCKFGPQCNNLSSIIRGFKSAVSSKAIKIEPGFKWQRLFYDRIIRDGLEYDFVRYYIIENPENWKPA